jgi:hypothetical protein
MKMQLLYVAAVAALFCALAGGRYADAFEADVSSTARLYVYYPDAPDTAVTVGIYGEDGTLVASGPMQPSGYVAGLSFLNWTTPGVEATYTVFFNATGVDGFMHTEALNVTAVQAVDVDPETFWNYTGSGGRTLSQDVSVDAADIWTYADRTITADPSEAGLNTVLAILNSQVSKGILLKQITADGGTLVVKQAKYQDITVNLGAGWDLTGKTVKLAAKQSYSDTTFVFEKTCTVTDAVSGYAELTLTDTDTAQAGSYKYEVLVSETDGTQPKVAKEGTLRITRSVWP